MDREGQPGVFVCWQPVEKPEIWARQRGRRSIPLEKRPVSFVWLSLSMRDYREWSRVVKCFFDHFAKDPRR